MRRLRLGEGPVDPYLAAALSDKCQEQEIECVQGPVCVDWRGDVKHTV